MEGRGFDGLFIVRRERAIEEAVPGARIKLDLDLGVSEHVGEIGNARGPLQLHYGLKDEHVPRAEIDAVAAGLRGWPNVEVLLYPDAGHSFANPVRPTYDPAAAKLAGERIAAMFNAI